MKIGGCIAGGLFVAGLAIGQQSTPAPSSTNQQEQKTTQESERPAQKAPEQNPEDKRKPPERPEEKRQEEIRQFDPLDRSSEQKSQKNTQGEEAGNSNSDRGAAPAVSLPGAVLDSGSADEEGQQYTGPAVLSRSYSVSRPLLPQQIRFRPFLGIDAVYDSGLTGVIVHPDGTIANENGYGVQLDWGVFGRRYWKRDQLGIDYRGNLFHYSPSSYYDGTNNSLNLDYTHLFTKRLALTFTENASIYANNYTLITPVAAPDTSIANVNLANTPNVQIFDNGLRQASTSANLTWQKSARLSFSGGGTYFTISRRSNVLFGSTGRQARVDVAYRFTRKTTVGVYYAYSEYTFPHSLGDSQIHTLGATYSYAINRFTQFRLRGGISYLTTRGLQEIRFNPVLALLLGQNTGLLSYEQKSFLSDVSVQITRQLHDGTHAYFSYAHGISPGNGLYLTSEQDSIGAGADKTFFRRYPVSLAIGRDSLSTLTFNAGQYSSEYARFGVGRNFKRELQASFTADYRYFNIQGASLRRNQLRLTLGVTWSAGERPLKLW